MADALGQRARVTGFGDRFLDAAIRALPAETDEQNLQRVLGLRHTCFLAPRRQQDRNGRAFALESMLRAGLDRARSASSKAAWFAAFRDVALTPSGLQWLESIWRRTDRIAGLTLAEVDEINIALELAVREVPAWREILDTAA